MSNVIDISSRGHEEAHTALQEVIAKWRRLGATHRQVGQLLIANALPHLWESEDDGADDLTKIATAVVLEEVRNLYRNIGGLEGGAA